MPWRNHLVFGFIILMLVSLLFSRALLSLSMAGFMLAVLMHMAFRSHFHSFFSTALLRGMTILFFIPLVSGLWSEDTVSWLKVIRVKLPFLLLPFAFAASWQLSSRQWKNIVQVFFLFVSGATLWSIFQYALDREAIHAAYLKAKTMPVPLEGDHVRFSWLVAIALLFAVMTAQQIREKWLRGILLLLAAWFLVYLHLLAARTGLFAAYLFLFALVLYKLFSQRNRKFSWLLLAVILLVPVASWFLFPTFQNRFKYLRYDFDFVKNSSYLPGATDGSRLFSFKAGWQLLKDHPLGVGAGDLRKATNEWYDRYVPGMEDTDKIYPSNEWLIHAGFAGWPGLILFSFVMALPFRTKISTHRFYWYCFHAMALFSFLVDTGLEVQFGVFLYAFITLAWWKWQLLPPR